MTNTNLARILIRIRENQRADEVAQKKVQAFYETQRTHLLQKRAEDPDMLTRKRLAQDADWRLGAMRFKRLETLAAHLRMDPEDLLDNFEHGNSYELRKTKKKAPRGTGHFELWRLEKTSPLLQP